MSSSCSRTPDWKLDTIREILSGVMSISPYSGCLYYLEAAPGATSWSRAHRTGYLVGLPRSRVADWHRQRPRFTLLSKYTLGRSLNARENDVKVLLPS